jgi:hypothetical protein
MFDSGLVALVHMYTTEQYSESTLTSTSMDERTRKTPNPKCQLFFKIDLLTDFAACV